MKKLWSFVIVVTALGVLVSACGSSSGTPLKDYFPVSNDVSGWVIDTSDWSGYQIGEQQGSRITNDLNKVKDWGFDGAFEKFVNIGVVMIGEEWYKRGDAELFLDILQLSSTAKAEAGYQAMLSYTGLTFTEIELNAGEDKARVANELSSSWRIEGYKGKYFIIVKIEAMGGSNCTVVSCEDWIKEFATAVLNKLP